MHFIFHYDCTLYSVASRCIASCTQINSFHNATSIIYRHKIITTFQYLTFLLWSFDYFSPFSFCFFICLLWSSNIIEIFKLRCAAFWWISLASYQAKNHLKINTITKFTSNRNVDKRSQFNDCHPEIMNVIFTKISNFHIHRRIACTRCTLKTNYNQLFEIIKFPNLFERVHMSREDRKKIEPTFEMIRIVMTRICKRIHAKSRHSITKLNNKRSEKTVVDSLSLD